MATVPEAWEEAKKNWQHSWDQLTGTGKPLVGQIPNWPWHSGASVSSSSLRQIGWGRGSTASTAISTPKRSSRTKAMTVRCASPNGPNKTATTKNDLVEEAALRHWPHSGDDGSDQWMSLVRPIGGI